MDNEPTRAAELLDAAVGKPPPVEDTSRLAEHLNRDDKLDLAIFAAFATALHRCYGDRQQAEDLIRDRIVAVCDSIPDSQLARVADLAAARMQS